MKKVLIILAAVALSGCVDNGVYGRLTSKDFSIVCLDGVEYYVRAPRGSYRRMMAVRIDSETLQPATCDGK